MPFQTTVGRYMPYGFPGQRFDDSPHRAQPFSLLSDDAANNVFARAFSITGEGIAAAGNAGGVYAFAGIMVDPQSQVLRGTSADILSPSLTVPNGKIVSMTTMGSWFVNLPGPATIGDLVIFNNLTGELDSVPRINGTLTIGYSFAYAFVDRFNVSDAGLAVITLTPGLAPPLAA